MSIVHLTGHLICATADEALTVAAHLPDHIARTRAEPGCISFTVTLTDDPLIWTVDERFEDRPAFDRHQKRVAHSAWGRATETIERRYTIDG